MFVGHHATSIDIQLNGVQLATDFAADSVLDIPFLVLPFFFVGVHSALDVLFLTP